MMRKVMELARPMVRSWIESRTEEELTELLDEILSRLDAVRYANQSAE